MRLPSLPMKRYAGVVAVLALLLALILALGLDTTVPAVQRSQLTVPALLITVLLGFVGVILLERTGYPGIWDAVVPLRHRLLIPLSLGLGFGVAFMLLRLFHVLPTLDEPPFPASIPYFLYGGLVSEILFRLFPMPLLVWLISNVMLSGRAQEPTSWAAIVLSSLIEPLSQVGAIVMLGMATGPRMASVFLVVFSANIVQGRLFRTSGFAASVVMRLMFYSIWHIVG